MILSAALPAFVSSSRPVSRSRADLRSERAATRKPSLVGSLLVLALGFSLLSVPLAAQTDFDGQTIQEIEFVGNRALPAETLEYYLGIAVGDPFSRDAIDRNIKRLWDRELIDDIRVEVLNRQGSGVLREGGGLKLVIEVKERPVVRSIEYEGLKRLSRNDIEDRILSRSVRLEEAGPLNLGEVHRVMTEIEDMYAEKGYRFAQASYRLEPAGEGERRVIFTVDEGDKVRIGAIRFEGNTVFGESRLRWTMKETKKSRAISRMLKKDLYDPGKLEEDLDSVRDLYRRAGYKNAVVGEPRLQVAADRPDAPTPEQQKRRLVLTVPIEEGNRWKFGELNVEGNDVYTDDQIRQAFRYRPGQWLRSKVIDEGIEAISDVYKNTGYIQARVTPELVERDDWVADVVVHVVEDDQFKVGRLEFDGNTRTRDKVLRREMRVYEGSVMSLGALRSSLFKIGQLGYFELNKEEPVRFETRADENVVDIVVQGEEADRTELQFGAGYSEGTGTFGQFAMKTQNFLGRGEQAGISIQTGSFSQFYELSYFVPWFLDRPQSAGIQIYDRSLNYDLLQGQDYREETTGGSLTYGRSLKLFQSLSLAYSRFDRFIRQEGVVNLEGEPTTFEFEQVISSIRPTYSYNAIDNRFEPTRGQRFQGSIEYAGGVLGGTEDFVRPMFVFSVFRPVTDLPFQTVFGLNVEGGLIEPFGGHELSQFSLFQLGGDNSVRGFENRRLWARDEVTEEILVDERGFPIGGDRFAQINLEYHLLLGGPFRLLLFVDAGNVYGIDQSFDLGRLRYSTGAELRITVPLLGGAPLRFIYANNLEPLPGDAFDTFSFSIGSSF